jgi:hypothetical protein
VVENDVEFRGAGCDCGAGFAEFRVCVLCAFVEAYDAGYDDGGAFEVGDAALDPVESDADGLVGGQLMLLIVDAYEGALSKYQKNCCCDIP